MNIEQESNESTMDSPLQLALGQALTRSLSAPALPSGFHARLNAAIARNAMNDLATERRKLESQHQMRLTELRQGYVRMQLHTLGVCIGAAFVGGVIVTLATPWLSSILGDNAVLAAPLVAGSFALAIGMRTVVRHLGLPQWLS